MAAIFVAGTGTDVGKTFVTALFLKLLRLQGAPIYAIKPVVSGFDPLSAAQSDPGVLLNAMGREISKSAIHEISPFRFAAPLAPDAAARREARPLPRESVASFCAQCITRATGSLLIEGVGGVMSPIADATTNLDLVEQLEIPVLLVGGSYLGAISHTLTALAALKLRDIRCLGVIINESATGSVGVADTCGAIAQFTDCAILAQLPRRAEARAVEAAAHELGLFSSHANRP